MIRTYSSITLGRRSLNLEESESEVYDPYPSYTMDYPRSRGLRETHSRFAIQEEEAEDFFDESESRILQPYSSVTMDSQSRSRNFENSESRRVHEPYSTITIDDSRARTFGQSESRTIMEPYSSATLDSRSRASVEGSRSEVIELTEATPISRDRSMYPFDRNDPDLKGVPEPPCGDGDGDCEPEPLFNCCRLYIPFLSLYIV